MSLNLNVVVLGGYLTRDPEIREHGGTTFASFTVAINREWKDKQGEKKTDVAFIDCKAAGRTAEVIGQYLKEGAPLIVDGQLVQETWEDKQTKAKRSKIVVRVKSFQFVGSGERESGERRPSSNPRREERARDPEPSHDYDPDPVGEEDVPFLWVLPPWLIGVGSALAAATIAPN